MRLYCGKANAISLSMTWVWIQPITADLGDGFIRMDHSGFFWIAIPSFAYWAIYWPGNSKRLIKQQQFDPGRRWCFLFHICWVRSIKFFLSAEHICLLIPIYIYIYILYIYICDLHMHIYYIYIHMYVYMHMHMYIYIYYLKHVTMRQCMCIPAPIYLYTLEVHLEEARILVLGLDNAGKTTILKILSQRRVREWQGSHIMIYNIYI